jgi:hypothetical protein
LLASGRFRGRQKSGLSTIRSGGFAEPGQDRPRGKNVAWFRDGISGQRQQQPERWDDPQVGVDFGIDFWDAQGLDFRAFRLCPETYRL